jgi:hypothetical protein
MPLSRKESLPLSPVTTSNVLQRNNKSCTSKVQFIFLDVNVILKLLLYSWTIHKYKIPSEHVTCHRFILCIKVLQALKQNTEHISLADSVAAGCCTDMSAMAHGQRVATWQPSCIITTDLIWPKNVSYTTTLRKKTEILWWLRTFRINFQARYKTGECQVTEKEQQWIPVCQCHDCESHWLWPLSPGDSQSPRN